jgi:hypothetical protein
MVVHTGCKTAEDSQSYKTNLSENSRKVISLAGQWLFKLDPADTGEKEKWFDSRLPERINLPGSTAENGQAALSTNRFLPTPNMKSTDSLAQ